MSHEIRLGKPFSPVDDLGHVWGWKNVGGAAYVAPTDTLGNPVNLATEATLGKLVMAVDNSIDETAYDLNSAAFSETTNITNDYIFDSIELNFSTAEAKTITVTSADGTILWGGDVDQTAANQGYNTTAQHIYLEFNRGFQGGDNITVDVTQLSSAGTMDCILKTRSGTDTLGGNPAIKWLNTSGTGKGFKDIDGRPSVSAKDYDDDVAIGNTGDSVKFEAIGENDDINIVATGEDMWLGAASTIPHPPVAGEQMTVVSTSANDAVAGTGVQTIRIEYIDGNGDAQTEDISLNGTTPVNTVATDIAFVNHMLATSVGSGGIAAGVIKIYKFGNAATIYNLIDSGGNKSLTCALRVPNGKVYLLKEWHCSISGGKPTAVRLRSTDWKGITYNGDDPVFLFKDSAFLGESSFDRHFKPPYKIPAGSTIKVTCWATQANAFGAASFNGYYEDA